MILHSSFIYGLEITRITLETVFYPGMIFSVPVEDIFIMICEVTEITLECFLAVLDHDMLFKIGSLFRFHLAKCAGVSSGHFQIFPHNAIINLIVHGTLPYE